MTLTIGLEDGDGDYRRLLCTEGAFERQNHRTISQFKQVRRRLSVAEASSR